MNPTDNRRRSASATIKAPLPAEASDVRSAIRRAGDFELTMFRKASRTTEDAIASNCFSAWAYFPGHLEHGNRDHGPVATIIKSFFAPSMHIKLHEHVVDEIVS